MHVLSALRTALALLVSALCLVVLIPGCSDTKSSPTAPTPPVEPSPTVTTIAPTSGLVKGGTAVTISGSSFAVGATVTIGGAAATAVTVTGSTSITAATPAHVAGAVSVVVTNPSGKAGTLPNGFTYFTYEGNWTGTTNQGRALSFVVNADNALTSLTVNYEIAYCVSSATSTITFTTPEQIVNGAFSSSVSGSLGWNLSGTFTSPTSASGTAMMRAFGCANPVALTWTATKS